MSLEQNQQSGMTPEQDAEYDRLDNMGTLNANQIRHEIGAPLVEHTVELTPAQSSSSTNKVFTPVPKNRLSQKEKMLADEATKHIREQLPYPR